MPSGSCMCGALSYSFSQPPPMKATCHCLTCRKKTGSTYLTTIMVPDSDFKSSGTAKTFDCTHEVGVPITFSFCQNCGTHLWKTSTGWPGCKIVFAGTLDGENDLENANPDVELWTSHRVKWAKPTGGQELEGFPQQWDRQGGKWVEVLN